MQVKVKKMFDDVQLPEYATPGSACFDIRAYMPGTSLNVDASAINGAIISTGLEFEIPEGFAMMIYSRSGHGFKNNTRLSNCVGVIDSDYRGEVKVKLYNDGGGNDGLTVKHGDRIAQAMLIPIRQVELVPVKSLTKTVRGEGGFGSTGAA